MTPYLLHVTILISAAYLFYKLVLQKETFFQLNRWVLLGSLLLAFSLPFIQIPEQWSLHSGEKNRLITSFNKQINPQVTALNSTQVVETNAQETNKNPVITKPIRATEQNEILSAAIPAKRAWNISVSTVLLYIYYLGLLIFLLNFILQFSYLLYKRFTLSYRKEGKYKIFELTGNESPYTFMGSIFINPTKYDKKTYTQILDHEKIHANQKHSIDIILAELAVILQWFNPLAWLHRKVIVDNLEFITDEQMLHLGTDRTSYQMNLLRVAVPQYALHLTNNYNQSILKKRIFMMNSKKSPDRFSWKYLFLIPLFGFSMVSLNAIKTAKANDQNSNQFQQEDDFQFTDQTIPKKEKNKAVLTQKKQVVTAESIAKEYNIRFALFTSGHWTAEIKDNEVCFNFKSSAKNTSKHWGKTSCFKTTAFSPALSNGSKSFSVERASGILSFNGEFTDNKGTGTYSFKENESFKTYLEAEAYLGDDEDFLFHCFFADINKDYISYLKKQGFKVNSDVLEDLGHTEMTLSTVKETYKKFASTSNQKLELEDLISLNIHQVKPEYVAQFKQLGLNELSWEDLVELSIHQVTPKYIKGLHSEGMKNLSTEDVITFAIHGVDAKYIKSFRNMGFRSFTVDEIAEASIHNVTPEYLASFEKAGMGKMSMEEITEFAIHNVKPADIQAFRNMGFRTLSADEIIEASIHNVTPEYLASFEKEGMGKLSIEEITEFAIHNVKPADIKVFRNMGFRTLSADEIIDASVHNVTPEYLASFEKEGMGKLSMEEITEFAIHNVKPADIKAFRSMGFRSLSADEIIEASIHNVTPVYIRSLHDLGFKDVSISEISEAKIHGVTAAFIQKKQGEGKKGLSLEAYTELKIHNAN